ncbi:MAG: DNA replication and repair protein RecF, partial [Candidatus Saccharimonas sp.]
MRLKRLSIQNFRVHKKCTVEFEDSVTLIIGQNGSGKTSLLEAIYISLRGKSFKGTDETIRRSGDEWYRIDLETDAHTRTVKHQLTGYKKTFQIDGKTHYRLTDKVKYPVVLFEPEDLRIVSGSPSRRREYLDTFIAQYNPHYSTTLHRYERALLQRNKLLKRPQLNHDEVFAWDVSLSRYGADIVAARQELIEYIDTHISEIYRTIAPTKDVVSVRYSHQSPITAQHLLTELEHAYERDRAVGATSVGPHRHDLLISFNDGSADTTGSRGELRTITLALKFIEASRIIETTGLHPIILLDDVFSELDHTRQHRLLSEFQNHQVIMTSVDQGN